MTYSPIYQYAPLILFLGAFVKPIPGQCPLPSEHISCNPDDIRFYLYANPKRFGFGCVRLLSVYNSNFTDYEELKHLDTVSIEKSRFDPSKPIKILAHGFTQNKSSRFPSVVKDAYLESGYAKKVNLIIVDWGKLSGTGAAAKANITSLVVRGAFEIPLYLRAAQNVPVVGRRVADFLLFLFHNKKVSGGDNIHLIGQSLGAHAMGIAGQHFLQNTSTLVGRITGTDPAGPGFQGTAIKSRLDTSDAKFVMVIHTNQGAFGYSGKLGHVDFFVNSMNRIQIQPGCSVLRPSKIFCSHNLAANYYAQSIRDSTIRALPACRILCLLRERDPVVFGENCPDSARGSYLVDLKL